MPVADHYMDEEEVKNKLKEIITHHEILGIDAKSGEAQLKMADGSTPPPIPVSRLIITIKGAIESGAFFKKLVKNPFDNLEEEDDV